MATNVTVLGGASGPTVSIPFTTAANAAIAQTAINAINTLVAASQMTMTTTSVSTVLANPAGTLPQGVIVTGGTGGGTPSQAFLNQIPFSGAGSIPGYTTFVDSNIGFVVAAGSNATTLVEAGGGVLFYTNEAVGAKIFQGSGIGVYQNLTQTNSFNLLVDGQAVVNAQNVNSAAGGISTVTSSTGSFTVLNAGLSSISAVAQGTAVFFGNLASGVSSTAAAAVTISGADAATSFIYAPGAGNAFINPGAGKIQVAALGGTGSETMIGGTGSATVFAGLGSFTGGSAGGNLLGTGTVNGATTLFGGGSGDLLFGFGQNDVLIAGAGNESLFGSSGTTVPGAGTVPSSAASMVFQSGNTGANTSIFTNAQGGDTIRLGSGSLSAFLNHGAGVSSTNAISLLEQAGVTGGNITLFGFSPKAANANAFDKVTLNAGVTATFTATGAGNGSTLATLSDGTKITFTGVGSAFIGQSGTVIS